MNRRLLLLAVTSLTVVALAGCGKKNIRDTGAPKEVAAKADQGELFAVNPNGSAEGELAGGEEAAGAAGSSLEALGINDVFFAFDSSEITAEARAVLAKDAAVITRIGGQYQIEGHCDERGSSEYNLALGDRRARSVRDALAAVGIDAATLSTISYGEERPFAQGHDESAWSQNRRGHFNNQ
ncbi:MAG TPA: peptidoglycan-associated lipoprotein [Proteobacteria bacterium]|nr:peptidoglycan-associated lipoprotein [Pseudomonadota bacterium]